MSGENEKITLEGVRQGEQAIVVLDGTDLPLVLSDDMTPEDAVGYVPEPLRRVVIAARLRFWADAFDAGARS